MVIAGQGSLVGQGSLRGPTVTMGRRIVADDHMYVMSFLKKKKIVADLLESKVFRKIFPAAELP